MMMVKRMRKEEDDHKSIIQRRAVLMKKLAELQDRENSEEVREKLNQIRSLLGKNKLDEADALMGTLKEKEEKTSSNCFIPSTYRSSGTNLEVTVVNRASDSVRQASRFLSSWTDRLLLEGLKNEGTQLEMKLLWKLIKWLLCNLGKETPCNPVRRMLR